MGIRIVFVTLLIASSLSPLCVAQRNVLLIIADDVGVDMIGAYAEHPLPATTPVIDQLAADGILFRNAWSLPTCSPTRAALLTGRLPYQTGIGGAIFPAMDPYEVALAETTLPELLGPGWNKGAIGKWHMHSDPISGIAHPMLQGFDNHRGAPWNLPVLAQLAYFDYQKSIDGVLEQSMIYATTDSVDDAIERIGAYQSPWFIWLAFNASHTPWHTPPHDLHSEKVPAIPQKNPPVAVRAMIQAMDTEIGRLLDSIEPTVLANTIVIFMGDNGTHRDATTAPFDPAHAKTTIFEGGINVPLIISGRGVKKGLQSQGLAQATDVFATILEIAGVAPPAGTSGVSLGPYFQDPEQASLRPWVYSERFLPNGFGPYSIHQRAVRGHRYKLIRNITGGDVSLEDLLFDLGADPFETTNLLDGVLTSTQMASYDTLSAVLDAIVPPWTDLGFALPSPGTQPKLMGGSTLLPGDTVRLDLTRAAKNQMAWLILGYAKLELSFKGGVLVPDPTVPGQLLPFPTDSAGEVTLAGIWPPSVPSGFQAFVQFWIEDPQGPSGFSASNALQLTAP